jgi:hypothetical protein
MQYNYNSESLYDSTEHTQKTFKNKITQEITESKNFLKKILTAGLIFFALFSVVTYNSESTQTPFLRAEADITTNNPLSLNNEATNGREVTPEVIAELKAESVKSMTPEQKKQALKILINEADENTLMEILK